MRMGRRRAAEGAKKEPPGQRPSGSLAVHGHPKGGPRRSGTGNASSYYRAFTGKSRGSLQFTDCQPRPRGGTGGREAARGTREEGREKRDPERGRSRRRQRAPPEGDGRGRKKPPPEEASAAGRARRATPGGRGGKGGPRPPRPPGRERGAEAKGRGNPPKPRDAARPRGDPAGNPRTPDRPRPEKRPPEASRAAGAGQGRGQGERGQRAPAERDSAHKRPSARAGGPGRRGRTSARAAPPGADAPRKATAAAGQAPDAERRKKPPEAAGPHTIEGPGATLEHPAGDKATAGRRSRPVPGRRTPRHAVRFVAHESCRALPCMPRSAH